jgi:energy-coupling factor transporter ATP-binding protein EcfA2
MALIRELNNDGTTIVLITHDMNIAQEANRTVRFRDGKIIADEPVIREAGVS